MNTTTWLKNAQKNFLEKSLQKQLSEIGALGLGLRGSTTPVPRFRFWNLVFVFCRLGPLSVFPPFYAPRSSSRPSFLYDTN